MFTRLRGIPIWLWLSITIATCFGFWRIVPNSVRNQIEPTVHATSTYIVNTTADHDDGVCDSADCTLREAINAANAPVNSNTSPHNIDFSIPGSGVHTINVTSPLPPLILSLISINGPTLNGMPLIEINGANAGPNANGLSFASMSGVTLSGFSFVHNLIINRFSGYGINIDTEGNLIDGCFIGTNAAGSSASPNGGAGIRLNGSGNIIGGTTAPARNVISGNTGDGIDIVSGASTVQGNFIGTNAAGTAAIANGNTGVSISAGINISGGSATVGGVTAGAGNLISGNDLMSPSAVAAGIYVSGGNGNLIQGNFIGTNSTGTVKVGNGFGIIIRGVANNTIGGGTAGARNIISGNVSSGVEITNATNNVVQGNFIGTDVHGTAKLGNARGVQIGGQSGMNPSNGSIGGTAPGAGNLISGNSFQGISLFGNINGINVQGNLIGTDVTGNAKLGNVIGIQLSTLSTGTTIGGTSAAARNVISGNSMDGILISTSSSNNQIQGNFVGTNVSGTVALANGGNGVTVSSGSNNVIGGTSFGVGSIISGNTGSGVAVSGGSGTLIVGNFIGLNATGTGGIGNTIAGVNISSGSATVGGTTAGSGNVISGNNSPSDFPAGLGIYITGGTGSQVLGNFIGTNPAGTAKLGNRSGVIINGAANNTIGGTTAAARNVISGNTSVGVEILNAGATNNVVQGNFVGTDVTGVAALGNGDGVNGIGVAVGQIGTGPSNVTIGGTAPGAGNVISANSFEGMSLFNDLNGVNVQGNLIGTDVTGHISLGGQRVGIFINTTSPGAATIGGTSAAARNIISGNEDGLDLNTFSTGITIQGNYIGTDITGSVALPNTSRGMFVSTNNTTIGGTAAGAGNVISGNGGDAIEIGNSSTGNLIRGNFIGTKTDGVSALGNSGNGVAIFTGASNNSIGGMAAAAGNKIAFNTLAGVSIDTGTGNSILGNSIFSNTGLGIDLSPTGVNPNDNCDGDTGPNNKQNFPVITSATAGANTATVQGTLNSTASTQFRIEFFSNGSCDPSGNGQGRTFLGFTNATTDASCNANFSFSVPIGSVTGFIITATATDPNNNTSEFSACSPLFGPVPTIQFSAASYTVGEGDKRVDTTITRSFDTGVAASVSFATSDLAGAQNCNVVNGVASSRCDYETRLATVKFAPGETSKIISVFIIDDSYLEGPETFNVNLSNPVGASLGGPSTATVTITDNDLANGPNPIDTAGFFVRVHYLDFLNREPDQSGLDFWTNQITSCGADQACIQLRRINVSAAFYLSIEFQQTGYLVERIYKSSFGDASGMSTLGGTHPLSVPIVRLNEFLLDTPQIGQGVVVNAPGWEMVLENNKQAFTLDFVQRSRLTTALPTSLTPAQFVNQLFLNAGVTPSASDRQAAINEFGSATNTSDVAARSRALRDVAENSIFANQEFNRAFVLMQYFGYLRRNPNDPQDTDYTGYEFWLNKLNLFNGNFVAAEMVKAFITSVEYRQRFGPP